MDEITYGYFCVLGGLKNPRCAKRKLLNGRYAYYLTRRSRWIARKVKRLTGGTGSIVC